MSVIQDYYNDRYYAWSITLKKVSNITDRLILSYPLSVFHWIKGFIIKGKGRFDYYNNCLYKVYNDNDKDLTFNSTLQHTIL